MAGARIPNDRLFHIARQKLTALGVDVSASAEGDKLVGSFAVPEGKLLVQSVDYFRSFIDDAYVFGQIAANHALGDLFAMGAEPQSVLAIATVPYGRERIVEETLFDVMMGALAVTNATGAVLAGGHSSEGAELAFGLTVNGLIAKDALLRKGGMQPGDTKTVTIEPAEGYGEHDPQRVTNMPRSSVPEGMHAESLHCLQ